jgi:hypothetical protein
MFYKTRFNPLTNGNHLSYIDKFGSKFHTIRSLKKYTKLNTTLFTYHRIKQLYKCHYYTQKKIIIVKYYYYKSKKNSASNNMSSNKSLDPTFNTNIFETYIKDFIDPNIKIIWKLKNSPGEMVNRF